MIFTIKSCQLNTKFDGENCIEAPVLIAGAFPIRSSSGHSDTFFGHGMNDSVRNNELTKKHSATLFYVHKGD